MRTAVTHVRFTCRKLRVQPQGQDIQSTETCIFVCAREALLPFLRTGSCVGAPRWGQFAPSGEQTRLHTPGHISPEKKEKSTIPLPALPAEMLMFVFGESSPGPLVSKIIFCLLGGECFFVARTYVCTYVGLGLPRGVGCL